MTRLEYIILTSLSGLVALVILLQLLLANLAAYDDSRLRATLEVLQGAQLDYTHLQQVANLTAGLAQKQNDQALRDVLARQNIQIRPGAATPPSAPAAAPVQPSTH